MFRTDIFKTISTAAVSGLFFSYLIRLADALQNNNKLKNSFADAKYLIVFTEA